VKLSTERLAPLTSPALVGDPTVPTASPGDADQSVASTAFVQAAITAALAAGHFLQRDVTATTSVGYTITPYNLGNLVSFTPNPALGNYQFGTNVGAVTLSAPTVDCAIDIMVTNSATAGAITFSGYSVNNLNIGDPLTVTNGHRFIISIRRMNFASTYVIKALQ
jgi:hypothetical protein